MNTELLQKLDQQVHEFNAARQSENWNLAASTAQLTAATAFQLAAEGSKKRPRKFVVLIAGGIGPKVWEKDVLVMAYSAAHAIALTEEQAREAGGDIATVDDVGVVETLHERMETMRQIANDTLTCLKNADVDGAVKRLEQITVS